MGGMGKRQTTCRNTNSTTRSTGILTNATAIRLEMTSVSSELPVRSIDMTLMIVPLLAAMVRAEIDWGVGTDGSFIFTSTGDADLDARIASCQTLLRYELAGRATGHIFAACDHCGRASMTRAKRDKNRQWPRCRMTPGCPGRHRPPPETDLAAAAELLRRQGRAALGQKPRQGRTRRPRRT